MLVHRSRGFGAAAVTPYFEDVPADHAWFDAIQWMKDRGISNGCETGKFCPDRQATRGEVAVFLYRALGSGGGQTSSPMPESGNGITILGKSVSPYLLGGGLLLLLALVRR